MNWLENSGVSLDEIRHRFWSKVRVGEPDECWPYSEFCNKVNGYGQFIARHGKPLGAHRVAYALEVDANLSRWDFICHSCDNPSCCNPKHLYKGTPKSNMDDMNSRGRGNQWGRRSRSRSS